jgi:dolichol-phosphate mannosyltransferase
MSPRAAFGLFAVFSLVRALLVPAFELMPQSAYYFTYAEHPALSYYDHPPMIGWLLWIGAALFGKSALAVRGTVFVTTLATQLAVFALGRRLLGAEAAGRALVFLTASGVALLLSFIATPDVPLLLFWALSLLALERAHKGLARSRCWCAATSSPATRMARPQRRCTARAR